MKIPALLLSVSISIALFPAVVRAETLDITPSPEPGDTIKIEAFPNRQGEIEGEIGPKPNRVKFPDLSKEEEFYSREDGFFNALPQVTQRGLKFNDPTPEEIKARFRGQIAHPTCDDVQVIKEFTDPETGELVQIREVDNQTSVKSAPVPFTPTQDFFQTLLRTRFWQSILVPQKGSDLNFSVTSSQPSVPDRREKCVPDTNGEPVDIVTIENAAPSPFDFLGGLADKIRSFLQNFFAGIFKGDVRVIAKLEQTKYLPGETVLADQTVGGSGFLNFFKPEGAKFTNQGDEKEQVAYRVLKEDRNSIGVTYKGVSSLKGGTLDLVKSLYPEGMAPASLAPVTPVSRPSSSLTFTIPYRDISVRVSEAKKQEIIRETRASFPETRIEELWDTVATRALDAGINPAFALTIWIEESGASDRGIERKNPRGYSAFGCFPNGNTLQVVPFERSLECFLNFTAGEKGTDFVEWVRYFCGPGAVPICSNNPDFLRRLKEYYDKLISPGTPGAATPIGTEF